MCESGRRRADAYTIYNTSGFNIHKCVFTRSVWRLLGRCKLGYRCAAAKDTFLAKAHDSLHLHKAEPHASQQRLLRAYTSIQTLTPSAREANLRKTSVRVATTSVRKKSKKQARAQPHAYALLRWPMGPRRGREAARGRSAPARDPSERVEESGRARARWGRR